MLADVDRGLCCKQESIKRSYKTERGNEEVARAHGNQMDLSFVRRMMMASLVSCSFAVSSRPSMLTLLRYPIRLRAFRGLLLSQLRQQLRRPRR